MMYICVVISISYFFCGISSQSTNNGGKESLRVKVGGADKVHNVMGSTAGAGSGDFHTYRNTRRHELNRLAKMESESQEEAELREFEERVEAKRKECEDRTRKNAEVINNTHV
jgi:hypothetical protein